MAFRRPLSLFFFLLLLSTQSTTAARKTHKIRGPIKTVVVLVMENRSFDHILGWLKSTRPEIDGLTGKESNRLSVSDPTSPQVHVTDDAYFIDSDPGHSFQAIREQIFGSNLSSGNPALMNGFAQQAESMSPRMSATVMSGFKPATPSWRITSPSSTGGSLRFRRRLSRTGSTSTPPRHTAPPATSAKISSTASPRKPSSTHSTKMPSPSGFITKTSQPPSSSRA